MNLMSELHSRTPAAGSYNTMRMSGARTIELMKELQIHSENRDYGSSENLSDKTYRKNVYSSCDKLDTAYTPRKERYGSIELMQQIHGGSEMSETDYRKKEETVYRRSEAFDSSYRTGVIGNVYRHSCTPLVNWGYRVPIHPAAMKVSCLIL